MRTYGKSVIARAYLNLAIVWMGVPASAVSGAALGLLNHAYAYPPAASVLSTSRTPAPTLPRLWLAVLPQRRAATKVIAPRHSSTRRPSSAISSSGLWLTPVATLI